MCIYVTLQFNNIRVNCASNIENDVPLVFYDFTDDRIGLTNL